MKSICTKILPALALLALASAGCGRPEISRPISVAQVETTLAKAFQTAPASVRQESELAAEAVRNQQPDRAYAALWMLNAKPELTPEQRLAASRAMVAVQGLVRRAADAGDAGAQDLLKLYRATK